MQGLVRKTPYGFEPCGEEGQKVHKSMAIGDLCSVEHNRHRNYKNLQRLFVFFGTVFDMQDHYDNEEKMRDWVLIAAGHCDVVISPNGEASVKVKSISYQKLPEEEKFRELFTKCITAVINYRMLDGKPFIPNMNESQLMKILQFD
tara:strand:- start:256 stop:693 length:438 start_codon:yes stop_codon:yes gene_type:complete